MATKIKGKVKEGFICVVKNEYRHRFAAENYLMLWIEDEQGKERPLLLTDYDRKIARKRAERRPDIVPTGSIFFNSAVRKGHITMVRNNRKHWFESMLYYVVKVTDENGDDYALAFTDYQLNIIERRTERNGEDIVKKSMMADLID